MMQLYHPKCLYKIKITRFLVYHVVSQAICLPAILINKIKHKEPLTRKNKCWIWVLPISLSHLPLPKVTPPASQLHNNYISYKWVVILLWWEKTELGDGRNTVYKNCEQFLSEIGLKRNPCYPWNFLIFCLISNLLIFE